MIDVLHSLAGYIKNAREGDVLLYIVASLFGIWVLWFCVITIFSRFSEAKVTRTYIINASGLISGYLAATFWSWLIFYRYQTGAFVHTHNEFACLTGLIISLGFVFWVLLRLVKSFRNTDLAVCIPFATSRHRHNLLKEKAQTIVNRISWFTLLPFTSIVLILFGLMEGGNLLSIVFDNSASMIEINPVSDGRTYLDVGKEALGNTLNLLKGKNTIVISTFKLPVTYKGTFDEILVERDPERLNAETMVFHEAKDAQYYLQNIAVNGPTPLTEAIWQNYLICSSVAGTKNVEHKKLLIITDGGESNGETLNDKKFFSSDPGFENMFNTNDICIIDIRGAFLSGNIPDSLKFLQKANSSGYEILDGSSASEYSLSLESFLTTFLGDRNILFVTLFFLIVSAIITFFIKPNASNKYEQNL